MATFDFSALEDGQTYAFNPAPAANGGDVLRFDDPSITAGVGPDADHQLDFSVESDGGGGTICFFSHGGKEIGLIVDPRALTGVNVTFASGSRFKYGDNSYKTARDDDGNTLTLKGASGGDWLTGGGGSDFLFGAGGNDMLVMIGGGKLGAGGYGNDTLNGGAGVDQLFYEGAALGINANLTTGISTGGRAGASTLNLISIENVVTGTGADTITGSSAANLLSSQEGNDRLSGGAGNDTLDGGAGADTMAGGAGDDAYFVNTGGDKVTESAGQGTDTIFSSVNRTLGNHQENLTLTGSADRKGYGNGLDNVINGNDGDNLLRGSGGDDTINGNGGADTIEGGSGNDSIDGGDGIDVMIGGSGNDTYRVIEVGDTVVEGQGGGVDTIITNRTITMAAHVENLIWFNNGAGGTCTGNALDNVMSASGAGLNLTMDGGAGSDTVSFEGQDVEVEVNLDAGFATFINALLSMENATGGNLDDDLRGDENANRLDGSAGADSMAGGYGGDTYVVDDVGDDVTEVDNEEILLVLPGGPGSGSAIGDITDTVIASINYALGEFVENLTLSGAARNATGNELQNVLRGNSKGNTLDGAAGADTLIGGGGNDKLVWDPADVYNGGSGGADTILMGAGNLNMKSFGKTRILSVERMDLRGDGDNVLTLARTDVLDMSSTDSLRVLGDAGDRVNANGFAAAGTSGGLNRYTSGLATLLVESDVQVVT